jgi:hypothetical protein
MKIILMKEEEYFVELAALGATSHDRTIYFSRRWISRKDLFREGFQTTRNRRPLNT